MQRKSLVIAKLALFTTLVMVATMAVNVYVPATRGYFNLGETMIYLTALLMGPAIAAFAGGVGSMLADIALGYSYYAPATLVIKACEGAIVGYLARKLPRKSGVSMAIASYVLIIAYFSLLLVIGMTFFVGNVELSIMAIPGLESTPSVVASILPYVWIPLAALAVATPFYFAIRKKEMEGWLILCMLAGGLAMVTGYFLYEQFIMGVVAIAEIPINLGQTVIGIAVAMPLYKAFKRFTKQ